MHILLTVAVVALVIVIIMPVQDNINRLWRHSFDTDLEEHPTGVSEVCFAITGVLVSLGGFFYA